MKKAFLLLAALMTAQIYSIQADGQSLNDVLLAFDQNTTVTACLVNINNDALVEEIKGIPYKEALKLFPWICEEYNANAKIEYVKIYKEEKKVIFMTAF